MDVLAGRNLSKFEDRITCKLSRGKTIGFALQDLHLTPVVVSHDLDFLSGVTDGIHAMSAGKIVLDDTVAPTITCTCINRGTSRTITTPERAALYRAPRVMHHPCVAFLQHFCREPYPLSALSSMAICLIILPKSALVW